MAAKTDKSQGSAPKRNDGSQKRRNAAAQTGIYLLVITGIVVFVNLLAAQSPSRVDVTKDERFSLSKGSGNLVAKLKSDLTVEVYVTRGLAKVNIFVDDLVYLLKEYERAAGGRVKLTITEPKTEEERKKAEEAGLKAMLLQESTKGNQASLAQGYMGIVLKYKTEKETIPQLAPGWEQGLEFMISSKIRQLRDRADKSKPKVGILKGKDELTLEDPNLTARQGQGGGVNLKGVVDQWFPFYDFEDVDLKDGADPIKKELVGLIMTQPKKDYTEKELRRIDEFLMLGGKSLAVFASAANLKQGEKDMKAELSTHGIEGLLRGYGVEMKKDVVLDWGSQFNVPVRTQTGAVQAIPYPAIALVNDDPRAPADKKLLDASFAGFFRLPSMPFPYPSTLELLTDKQPNDVKLTAVARTTPNATALTDSPADLKWRFTGWQPKGQYAQRIIAATVEGKLKSAYAGQKAMDGITVPERAPKESRILVISSSQFLTNPFAYSGNGPEMGGRFQMFGAMGGDRDLLQLAGGYAESQLKFMLLGFSNMLSWTAGDMDLLAISAKLVGNPDLTYSSLEVPVAKPDESKEESQKRQDDYEKKRDNLQSMTTWSLTFSMPIVFALIGLVRWQTRESGRNKRRV